MKNVLQAMDAYNLKQIKEGMLKKRLSLVFYGTEWALYREGDDTTPIARGAGIDECIVPILEAMKEH